MKLSSPMMYAITTNNLRYMGSYSAYFIHTLQIAVYTVKIGFLTVYRFELRLYILTVR